MKTAQLG